MIREATRADVPEIMRLIHELAAYEKEPEAVVSTEADLDRWLFGDDAVASALIAESPSTGSGTAKAVGMALWFRNYSTWTGQPGVYLEDLYVDPDHRGSGLGKALLVELARIAVERGYSRVEWSVLNWNQPSIDFYEALGARPQDEWTVYRLAGEALTELGRQL
ncbi:GNAT family N-acetyltransferase [Nocardioides montaniterrae]